MEQRKNIKKFQNLFLFINYFFICNKTVFSFMELAIGGKGTANENDEEHSDYDSENLDR